MLDVTYIADDELTQLLQDAATTGRRFRLVAGSRTFFVRVDPDTYNADVRHDPFQTYDPEAVKKALAESFGILQDVDVEALLRDLRAQRGLIIYDDEG